ncbi:MAG: hypothetical protein LLG06_08740 [Desulfobacteraceae bacterium]|nr:hypothetical protein [Desulfobacteraceae bacterium]
MLAVDLMPAEAYEMDEGVAGRVAGLVDFRIVRPSAQTVYLPQAYEPELRDLYEGFEDGCRIDTGSGTIPWGLKSKVETTVLDFAQLAKHCFHEAGEDFGEAIDAAEAESAGRGCVIHHVVLNLSYPWRGRHVDMLRSRGYFFGGLLPRWFDDGGFLMQKTKDTPNWDGIKLFSERARKIGEIARVDWAGTAGR